VRLYLLRHGEVASHRGDVPITDSAVRHARAVGVWFWEHEDGPIRLLTGETTRAVDSAAHIARGIVEGGGEVNGPEVAFALRNPDLYVNGVRVNMVSSAETLAAQVDELTADEVAGLDFFPDFFASPDRIGWWLTHESPPGETSAQVATRMRQFIASLADPTGVYSEVVVAVTHSPLLRAVGLDHLGRDIGEPAWITGLLLTVDDSSIDVDTFDPGVA
jgi:broad specificity phosphatase PhoE